MSIRFKEKERRPAFSLLLRILPLARRQKGKESSMRGWDDIILMTSKNHTARAPHSVSRPARKTTSEK